jgi:hypothetical protein
MRSYLPSVSLCIVLALIAVAASDPARAAPSSIEAVHIISPNGGEQLLAGNYTNITWDGGAGYNSTLYFSNKSIIGPFKKITENATSPYNWTIPNEPTTMGYILVRVYDNSTFIGEDTSDYGFVIMGLPERHFDIKYPNGGEHILNGSAVKVSWKTDYPPGFKVTIWYTCEGATGNYTSIASNLTDASNHTWIANGSSSDCFIKGKVSDKYGSLVDYSDEPFQVYDYPRIALITPRQNESVKAGSKYWVTWNTSGGSSRLKIDVEFKVGNGTNFTTLGSSILDSGKYEWDVPGIDSSETYLRVIGKDEVGNFAMNTSKRFKITPEGMELGVITGFVRDANGILKSIFVDLYNYTYGANNTTHRARTTTGYDGNYTFREIVPGSYMVVCDIDGYERLAHVIYVRGGGVSYANLTLKRKAAPGLDIIYWSMILVAAILAILAVWIYQWRKERKK